MAKNKSDRTTKSNPLGAGRKWFDGKDEKEVIAKLEEATALDASVEECLFYADISRDSYYRYLKANKDFAIRLSKLREKPVMLARKTVVAKMTENYSNAMDYLSRKKKLEFSQRNELTGPEGTNLFEPIQKKVNKLIDSVKDDPKTTPSN